MVGLSFLEKLEMQNRRYKTAEKQGEFSMKVTCLIEDTCKDSTFNEAICSEGISVEDIRKKITCGNEGVCDEESICSKGIGKESICGKESNSGIETICGKDSGKENRGAGLLCEHGLSLYIETTNHKILFDTGRSGVFADNAEKLGIDLDEVDIAVISHGHYDHGNGLSRFLAVNHHAPVYINRRAFGGYYSQKGRFIGIDPAPRENRQLIFTDDECRIDDELFLCTCNGRERTFPSMTDGLTEECNDGSRRPDLFLHEQYLIITEKKSGEDPEKGDGKDCWNDNPKENRTDSGKENDKKVVFSACSHKGVLNIVSWLKPDVFVGGFHFFHEDVQDGANKTLDQAAGFLNAQPCVYYTGHCTGTPQYAYLKKRMGDRLHGLSTGCSFKL